MKVVYLDDEILAVNNFKLIAKEIEGIDCLTCFTSPIELLEYSRENHIDLAFLDIEMPVMSGIELAKKLFEYTPDIEIVFVTGYDEYAFDSYQIGVLGYLLKPYDLSDISKIIRRAKRLVKRDATKELTPLSEQVAPIDYTMLNIVYQPIVDAKSESAIGYEALLRIAGGNKSPLEFILSAEKNGTIWDITKFTIQRVCQTIHNCRQRNTAFGYFAVNISGLALSNLNFINFVEQTISHYAIEKGDLVFEITETCVFFQKEEMFQKIKSLRGMGIRIAIDDFGTEYSSLSRLSSIDFDILKIDKSFLHQIHAQKKSYAILKFIVDLSLTFNATTIVEGVETKEQKNMLLSMGCNHMQGYYFGKPQKLFDFNSYYNMSGENE